MVAARGESGKRDAPRGRALSSSARSTAPRSERSSSPYGLSSSSELVEELAQELVVSLGVLPDIEGRDVEPESPDEATDTAKKSIGNGLAPVRGE